VGELHACDAALLVNESRDATQKLNVCVIPDTQILRADAPFGQDRRSFGEDKTCATNRT
jgi:hypothetical protein